MNNSLDEHRQQWQILTDQNDDAVRPRARLNIPVGDYYAVGEPGAYVNEAGQFVIILRREVRQMLLGEEQD